ncbi:MAG TPA: hypothetical protein DHW82_10745 [Spirochaetia bacterium]|nr:MAG: hypothetical protein A2Y41_13265 [Spirochaetes bacterium GWB1_36_13]HCL57471.1 hypothetical protein [Spirochaetia bacterium]
MKDQTLILNEKRKLSSTVFLENRGILLILSKNALGKSFIIDQNEVSAGRDSEKNFISIDDSAMSNTHFVIRSEDGSSFSIEDLNSTNSTFLNNKKLSKKTDLVYGDRILAGNTIFRFFIEEKI